MIFHDDIATRVGIDDASWREMDLVHFAGCHTLTLRMRDHRHVESRIDRRVAGELAHLFDHFARHGKLPVSFPQPDYMI